MYLIVAWHERRHYIFIRFEKLPMEAAILFARFRPCSSQYRFVPGNEKHLDEIVLLRRRLEPSKQYGCLHGHFSKPHKNIVPPLRRTYGVTRFEYSVQPIVICSISETTDLQWNWYCASIFSCNFFKLLELFVSARPLSSHFGHVTVIQCKWKTQKKLKQTSKF